MIITIFFTIASVSLIIIVPVYLRKKNTNQLERIKLKGKRKNIKTIWGINEIEGNNIIIKDKTAIIIELGGIEYSLLNEEEQNHIDDALTNLAKTFTYQTQFFSTVDKIDTANKIQEIKENLEKQKNEKTKQYGQSIIRYLESIMEEENLYVKKNYLIISSSNDKNKVRKELNEIYNNIKYTLNNVKIITKLLDEEEIIELIYKELNKNSYEKIKNIVNKGGMEFYVTTRDKE